MGTIIQNLNTVINTKSQLQSILNENGISAGEVFSEYPDKFRTLIASGGTDKVSYSYLEERLSDYVSYSYGNSNYVSYSYLYSYLADWGSDGERTLLERMAGVEDKTTQLDYRVGYLDSYTNSYNTRISALENAGFVTSSGLNTAIDARIGTVLDNSSYVSKTELSAQSYSSKSYVVEYVQTYAASTVDLTDYARKSYVESYYFPLIGGNINGNIIPSSTNTYTLGDASHLFSATYSAAFVLENGTGLSKSSSSRLDINLNGDNKFYVGSGGLFPVGTKQLGSNGTRFDAAYFNRLYLNGVNVEDDYATKSYVLSKIPEAQDLSNYVTYTYLYTYVGSVVGDIESLLANI